MLFYERLLENLDIAILEAIAAFAGKEGIFCRKLINSYDSFMNSEDILLKNEIIAQYINDFESFSVVFGVIRNFDKNKNSRLKLLKLIFTEYLPSINKGYSPQNIDIYSEKAYLSGVTHGKATSAFSKIAYIYKPDLYFPYDKNARNILKNYLSERGLKVNLERSYYNYSSVIDDILLEFDQHYKIKAYISGRRFLSKLDVNKYLINKNICEFYEACSLLNIKNIDDFIYRRTLDKLFIMYNGINKKKFVAFNEHIVT